MHRKDKSKLFEIGKKIQINENNYIEIESVNSFEGVYNCLFYNNEGLFICRNKYSHSEIEDLISNMSKIEEMKMNENTNTETSDNILLYVFLKNIKEFKATNINNQLMNSIKDSLNVENFQRSSNSYIIFPGITFLLSDGETKVFIHGMKVGVNDYHYKGNFYDVLFTFKDNQTRIENCTEHELLEYLKGARYV